MKENEFIAIVSKAMKTFIFLFVSPRLIFMRKSLQNILNKKPIFPHGMHVIAFFCVLFFSLWACVCQYEWVKSCFQQENECITCICKIELIKRIIYDKLCYCSTLSTKCKRTLSTFRRHLHHQTTSFISFFFQSETKVFWFELNNI